MRNSTALRSNLCAAFQKPPNKKHKPLCKTGKKLKLLWLTKRNARMNDVDKCLDVDKKVAIYACVFRSIIDAFYAIHIIFQFRTGFIASSSRGGDQLNDDPKAIAKRYLLSYFIIDILSILPLPQTFLTLTYVSFFLSSLGQNLQTSTFVWEILFAVSISIFGLVLFALLIGNFQKYLQSTTGRVEEMLVKKDRIRQLEEWMARRLLPRKLRDRIRRSEEFTWKETRGIEEENLIRSLPKDLKRDIKRHLCLTLLRRVPLFYKMDGQLLDALCDRLKPVLYTEKSFIVREGDPVDEMLFIMRGNLATMTTNGGRTGFLNTADLKAGDFCGEELLTWALDPHSSTNYLPMSTRTVNALVEVEAYALMADDLKFVATQFRFLHSLEVLLSTMEDVGSLLYPSSLAPVQGEKARVPQRLQPPLLQKPAAAEDH
ncbi:hypothetical protein FH972_003808 [Carpinus fangiana]|uniref:Cyclic nucleotide-binding domain-containing protein n=1 Tax=Carpinus fangiana TaxID=176857 RepID=A0A5N6QL38_9ROSI|nr:hypothetical protein FH972_003808 [Carpinus fangiana]